jgi:hypothetical protein
MHGCYNIYILAPLTLKILHFAFAMCVCVCVCVSEREILTMNKYDFPMQR